MLYRIRKFFHSISGHRWTLWQLGDGKINGIYCAGCSKSKELPLWNWEKWRNNIPQGVKI